jgi:hypothetical protein
MMWIGHFHCLLNSFISINNLLDNLLGKGWAKNNLLGKGWVKKRANRRGAFFTVRFFQLDRPLHLGLGAHGGFPPYSEIAP